MGCVTACAYSQADARFADAEHVRVGVAKRAPQVRHERFCGGDTVLPF